MMMNVRAGGTEGVGRGREMGRRGPPFALWASLRAGETELFFEAQEDSISTQGWASQ